MKNTAKIVADREKKQIRELKRKFTLVRREVSKLLEAKYPDVELCIVGSVARNQIKTHSDIDFILVNHSHLYFEIFHDIENICLKHNVKFDIIDYEGIKLKERKDLLKKEFVEL